MKRNNVFDKINLVKCERMLGDRLSNIHYNILLDQGKEKEAKEYFDTHAVSKYQLIIKPTRRALEFIDRYRSLMFKTNEYLTKEEAFEFSFKMAEVSVMADIYLTLRRKIRGRGAAERKDDLAIQFFSYAFRMLDLDPFNPADLVTIELLTNLDINTGGDERQKEKKDKRIKFIKRTYCYIRLPGHRS